MTTIDHPQASTGMKPRITLPEGQNLPPTKYVVESKPSLSAAPNLDTDHDSSEAQAQSVGADQTTGGDHRPSENQTLSVATGLEEGEGHRECEAQVDLASPLLHSPILALAAEVVDDLEKVRNANQNRLRQLTRVGVDKDGLERGFGLDVDNPDVLRLAALVEHLSDTYDEAVKNLQKVMREHPLGPWCKRTSGVGEKQLARLLAAIGDPYWHLVEERPRTVSELWAYSGYHVIGGHAVDHNAHEAHTPIVGGVAPRRQKGKRLNWSQAARMRAYLIAESCLKAKTSPYRPVYYAAREKYAEAIHAVPCVQCGTKGKPAEMGTPLRDGHKHSRAIRAMAKEMLKDLWIESKRLHELQEGPSVT